MIFRLMSWVLALFSWEKFSVSAIPSVTMRPVIYTPSIQGVFRYVKPVCIIPIVWIVPSSLALKSVFHTVISESASSRWEKQHVE